MFKNIAILGSTGSIGRQTLDVCRSLKIRVHGLACGDNINLLAEQICEFHPKLVAVRSEDNARKLASIFQTAAFREKFSQFACEEYQQNKVPEILVGEDGNVAVATIPDIDCIVAAMVGFSGLNSVIRAIKAGKNVALANKETLVTAGNMIIKLAEQYQVRILPVDSEHSAIWQCLQAGRKSDLKRIFLTASGGPFRLTPTAKLATMRVKDALKHPTWSMGAKITVDSATLMNKGLEVIEAARLFAVAGEAIQVVVHPQSIVHSMIEWNDGSVLAQLGFPDMRIPIKLALSYPDRIEAGIKERFNPFAAQASTLTFEPARSDDFPLLNLAYEALKIDGLAPTYLNAVNEEAVGLFLADKINFAELNRMVIKNFNNCLTFSYIQNPSYDDIIEADSLARSIIK